MKIRTADGNELGLFAELRRETTVKTNILVDSADTGILKAEIERREKVEPFIRFGDQIVEEIKRQGGKIDDGKQLVFEREFDILGRPNVWIGINSSNRSLEEIVAEDRKIKEGLLPRRKSGESKIVWTDRLVIYKDSVVAPYATAGTEVEQKKCIDELLLGVLK